MHLRTTKTIESNFATVRHRTKGPGSRAAGLAMAFKLIEATQDRWRAVNAPHLVALVAPERPSPAANSSSGLVKTPSPKPPNDHDPQVLTISPSPIQERQRLRLDRSFKSLFGLSNQGENRQRWHMIDQISAETEVIRCTMGPVRLVS